jgi:hypothetical protein
MMPSISSEPQVMAKDPLLAATPLPYHGLFYPQGFPVSVASNSAAVLRAAGESWAGCEKWFDTSPVEIRCLVDGSGAESEPPFPVFRALGHQLVWVSDTGNFASCDLRDGMGCAWVTEAVAADSPYFRYHFLEAMVYNLLATMHTVPIHAACVALDGRGVLLAGDSGAGKSSLAYACARSGWVFVSDDASSLLRSGHDRRVIGNPGVFRFRDNASGIFPEFAGFPGSKRGAGKPTVEVKTASLPAIRTAPDCMVEYVVFLRRPGAEPGAAKLTPVSAEDAVESLFLNYWPPELPAGLEGRSAVERLVGAGAYEMHYRDLDAAVGCLERLLRNGRVMLGSSR